MKKGRTSALFCCYAPSSSRVSLTARCALPHAFASSTFLSTCLSFIFALGSTYRADVPELKVAPQSIKYHRDKLVLHRPVRDQQAMHLPQPRHAGLFRPPRSLLGVLRGLGYTRFCFGAQPFFVLRVQIFFSQLFFCVSSLRRFSVSVDTCRSAASVSADRRPSASSAHRATATSRARATLSCRGSSA